MNNYFEQTIANLPYDVYNGRYAILVDTHEDTNSGDSMYSFLVNEQKFESTKVSKLAYKNATIENFEQTVSNFESIVDKNSFLYVMLDSHGNMDGFCFNDGNGTNNNVSTLVSYEDIGDNLDAIESQATIISLMCCGSEGTCDSITIASSPNSIASMPATWIFATSKNYINRYPAVLIM